MVADVCDEINPVEMLFLLLRSSRDGVAGATIGAPDALFSRRLLVSHLASLATITGMSKAMSESFDERSRQSLLRTPIM